MSDYEKALIEYYEQQGADTQQIEHIKGNKQTWK